MPGSCGASPLSYWHLLLMGCNRNRGTERVGSDSKVVVVLGMNEGTFLYCRAAAADELDLGEC